MKKFKVYDMYADDVCIGYADTVAEVMKIARQQYFDTDGECVIWYVELDPVTQKYERAPCRVILIAN